MTAPEILRAMPAAEYHADPAPVASLSSSIAHLLVSRSALHAWFSHPRLNPDYVPMEKDVFDYGDASHALLLEGTEQNMVIVEADDWRKKDAQELRKAAREAGKTPLLARQMTKVRAMVKVAQAAIADSEIAGAWAGSASEQSLFWQEGATHCRARLDRLSADQRIIFDYKTTTSAHPDAVLRSIINYGFDIQEAFYRRGVKALTGKEAKFVFLCQEKEPPFACSLVALDPAMQDMAEHKVAYALALWERCMETGIWRGYPNRIAYLSPPAWYAAQAEELANDDEFDDKILDRSNP